MMTLRDLVLNLSGQEIFDLSNDTPVVLQQDSTGVAQVAAAAQVLTPCYWNKETGEILSIDDEDIPAGFVRAVALMTKW